MSALGGYRHEFDFRGKHWESLNKCLLGSGCNNRDTIVKERTNLKKVKIIPSFHEQEKDKSYKKATNIEKGKDRRDVEDYLEKKALESFDNWCEGL